MDQQKRQQRNGHRTHCKKLSSNTNEIISNFTEESEGKLLTIKRALTEKLEVIETLDNEILNAVTEEEAIGEEIQSAGDFRLQMQEVITRIDLFLTKLATKNNESEIDDTQSTISAVKTNSAKLPKLTLSNFYGDPSRYNEFWDSFETAVHSNETLEDVTKFSYLKSILKGQALAAVSGLPITSDSYKEAINILKLRYGNK